MEHIDDTDGLEPLGITVKQAARLLNCSTGHIYALKRRGDLQSFHIGDLFRIDYSHFKTYVASLISSEQMPRSSNPYGRNGKPENLEAAE
jgi:excisionase family DNA binding protein